MNIPQILNTTGITFGPMYLADEEARPVLVLLARASFRVNADSTLAPLSEPAAISPEGAWTGEPGRSSYRLEPDIAFVKVGTDVVLLGDACAARSGTTMMDVGLKVGPLQKIARVFGERCWVGGIGGLRCSDPLTFERMPLVYERAYGGWDRSNPDHSKHEFDARNPVGTGFIARTSHSGVGVTLPNVEDPQALIRSPQDRPPPAGFGFVAPHWEPRAGLAGTYDEAWQQQRSPRLPESFDRRYFSAASPGLTAHPFLRGDEAMLARGVAPEGDLHLRLPGLGRACFSVHLRNGAPRILQGELDTVVLDATARCIQLTWRAHSVLSRGAQDVVALQLSFDEAQADSRRLLES